MKKYIHSQIKKVPLAAEQAVLEVCQIGGAYFFFFSGHGRACMRAGTGGVGCNISIRGQMNTQADNMGNVGAAYPS